jgi:enterochelin esterase-like enzyme
MKIWLLILALTTGSLAEGSEVEPLDVTWSLETFTLESSTFHNARTIRVLLPHLKGRSVEGTFPVLLMNDGLAAFDPEGWDLPQVVKTLVATGKIPPLVVVGIDNAGAARRADEYLPLIDETFQPPMPQPHGARYPSFLAEEVLPAVRARFPISTDRDRVGLGGGSYGATIALYTTLTRPDLFGKLLLESPALYMSGGRLLEEARTAKSWPTRVSLGIGSHETGNASDDEGLVEDVRSLERAIRDGAPRARTRLVVEPTARHEEAAWGRRAAAALIFLFGP